MNRPTGSVLATVAGTLSVVAVLWAPVSSLAQNAATVAPPQAGSTPAVTVQGGAAAKPNFDPPAEPTAEVPSIKFDKVSFKPCKDVNRNTRTIGGVDSWGRHCEPIRAVITLGYTGLVPFRWSGEPAWVDTEPYDFQAKVAPEDVAVWQKMTVGTRRIMVRNMLADVLHLKVHAVTELRPMYALVVAPGGLKLKEYKDGDSTTMPNGQVVTTGNVIGGNHVVVAQGMSLGSLAGLLTARLDRDVVDKTGLTGHYNYTVQVPSLRDEQEDPEERAMFTAATLDNLKQFGLKLEPVSLESTLVVVDHIDRPSE